MNYHSIFFVCLLIIFSACSKTPERLTKKGIHLNKEKKFSEAISFFDEALLINENYHYAIFQRGNSFYALENYLSAIDDYKSALELEPNEFYAFNLGLSEFKLKNYDNALIAFETAEEYALKDPNLFLQKGNTFFKLGRYEESIHYLDMAIQSFPDSTYLLFIQGCSLYQSKLFEEALIHLTSYLNENYGPSLAFVYAAKSAYNIKEFGLSVSLWEQYIENGFSLEEPELTDIAESYAMYGRYLYNNGEIDQAKIQFNKANNLKEITDKSILNILKN